MPQLDSLRTFAVFAVMVHHFWPEATFNLPLGFVGVQLFFVLSGFLITGILWPAREAVQTGRWSARTIFQRFYIRRFLRIFPLFYGTLAILCLLGISEVRDSLPWHVSYLSNFYFAKLGWFPNHINHLWSLAVEEQFYLVWPFVIVLTPRRFLLPTLVAIAAIGPAYRWIGGLMDVDWMWTFTPPFANVDSLALGGILAYAWATESEGAGGAGAGAAGTLSLRARMAWVGGWIGTPLVIGLSALSVLHMSLGMAHAVFEYTIWAIFFVWLIDGAGRGFTGPLGKILELKPLLYLGQISYGLYVFHPLTIGLARWTFAQVGRPYPDHPAMMFVLLVAGTIAIATCSWHLYEKPLNDLKRHFDFRLLAAEHAENAESSKVRHEDPKNPNITKKRLTTEVTEDAEAFG
jgi:peptidoglycan/LPS O-acetylase OafA/YrhL